MVDFGPEFIVNSTTFGGALPTVAALSDGRFVVTFGSDEIRARLFNADGTPVGDDFVVNSTTSNSSMSNHQNPVAALPDGGFVVTWESADSQGNHDIRARLFDASGNAVGSDFVVTSSDSATQPTVAALPDGHFAVTWISHENEEADWDICARLFDASGNAVGSDFVVNSTTANDQMRPTVTALRDGHVVMTWHSNSTVAEGGTGWDIRARLFDANGNALLRHRRKRFEKRRPSVWVLWFEQPSCQPRYMV